MTTSPDEAMALLNNYFGTLDLPWMVTYSESNPELFVVHISEYGIGSWDDHCQQRLREVDRQFLTGTGVCTYRGWTVSYPIDDLDDLLDIVESAIFANSPECSRDPMDYIL